MALDKNDRLAGMVFGSLTADALALGAHWVYDQAELEAKFGRVADYKKPLADSYHPTKQAGEQTHYGDQTLVLLDSLMASGHYHEADFFDRWHKLWNGYGDYRDHATKETLVNYLEKGVKIQSVGSHSEELGGAARLAPLLALMIDQPLEAQIAAARRQTAVTHASPIAVDAAEFLTRVVAAITAGNEIEAAVAQATAVEYKALPAPSMREKVARTRSLEMKAAALELGQSCPAEAALPTLLALLARHPDDLETALIENVMAGGDSAARGLALGLILGARHGASVIPARWIEGLQARPRVEAFLEKLS